MGTAPTRPGTSAAARALAEWGGPALWAAGAVGLGLVARTRGWSAGELVLAGGVWLLVLLAVARGFVRHMFGPVFAYEILRLGRRRGTFVFRGLYVLAVCGLLALMYLSWLEEVGYFYPGGPAHIPANRLANFSARFFYAFQAVQFGVMAFLTPAYVAGSIADEKERKTLEFLLATDLRNREIVFGKLAARVATLLMFVLAGLPVLAFLQLFGGIDPELLLAGTAATFVTIVGLSAWGICLSVLVKKSRDAIALTYLTAIVYVVVSTTAGVLTRGFYGTVSFTVLGTTVSASDVTDWLAAGNLGYLLSTMSGPNGTGWVADVLMRYAAWWAVVGAVLLGVAVAGLRPVALRQAYGGSGRTRTRRTRLRRAVGNDPVFWKEVFVDAGGRGGAVGRLTSVMIVLLVFGGPVLIVVGNFGDLIPWLRDLLEIPPRGTPWANRWRDFEDGMSVWVRVATGLIGALAMLAAAVRGAGVVTGERERDTWVSLVSTPLSSWEMLLGKWWGCVLGPRRIYAVLALMWLLGVGVGAVSPLVIPFLVVLTAVYVSAFAWLGIFFSITARTTLAATVQAITASAFLGGGFWFVFALCCVVPLQAVFSGPSSGLEYFFQNLAQLMLGATPPFVLGWMPLNSFGERDIEPFSWEQHRMVFGPLAPVLGAVAWGMFAFLTAQECKRRFQTLTNRDPWRRPVRPLRRPAHTDAGRPSA